MKEATITINGYTLDEAQAMTLRIALTVFRMELAGEPTFVSLSAVGKGYRDHLDAVLEMITDTPK